MKPYLAILSSRFRTLLQYRTAALAGAGTQVFFGLLRVMIFDAFYRSSTAPQPMSSGQVTTYIWLGQAMMMLMMINVDPEIAAMVRTGSVAYEMNSFRLYCRYIEISFRAQMQYRASFLVRTSAHFMVTGLEFLGLAAVFQRFGQIRGWTLPQMAFFYGIVSMSFAAAEAVVRGFDIFSRLIKSGDFDRVLLRPRSTAFQILGQELQLMRIGRFTQGALVLLWAAGRLDVEWTAAHVALLAFSVVGGACLFSGLFIVQAAICFWTTESVEIVYCLTYGGVDTAQFPITIYRPWFRNLFTFVIPLATINYFPAHAIMNLQDTLGSSRSMQWASPAAGVLFLLACLRMWNFGVRRYTSTGS